MSRATTINTPTRVLTPPLKWAGGKRWLVPRLCTLWEPHHRKRLVEPFCGGLSVALGLMPNRALLNDINPHLISFFSWLRKGLRLTIPTENDTAVFYAARTAFNELIARGSHRSRTAAEYFYYLNRTGYNGLCRFNRRGEFNVPFGSYKTINYTRDFTPYKVVLSKWQLSNVDFEKLRLGRTDFVYADPPYDVEFRQYSKGGFTWDDQVRLAAWLARHRGPVVASNQATGRILELYRTHGFDIRIIKGPRRISCTGDRAPANEMLAVKNLQRRRAGQ